MDQPLAHLGQEAALPGPASADAGRAGEQVGAALAAIGLAPGPGLSADQVAAARAATAAKYPNWSRIPFWIQDNRDW